MTAVLMTAAVSLAVFALVATVASLLVSALAPAIARRFEGYAPAACAAGLFRLRMLPGALAAFVSFAVVLPTFAAYEPADTQETLPAMVMLAAVVGAALLGRGLSRAAQAWLATRDVVNDWRQRGRRLDLFDTPLPVYAVEESFPTVAVVGVMRPMLFIAERVLRECPADEVRAMLHHECAHVTKRDNLKRFVMRACPDFVGAELDRAWARAAEEAADAAVVAGHPSYAVELAQALIHVARLAPVPQAPTLASAFYLGGSIESRVRRLVQPSPVRDLRAPLGRTVFAAAAVAVAAAAIASAPALHRLLETAVQALP